MSNTQQKNCPHCTLLNPYNETICKACNRTMDNPLFLTPPTSPTKSIVSTASPRRYTSPIDFDNDYSYSSDSDMEVLDTNNNQNKENINPINQANKMKQSIQKKSKLQPMTTLSQDSPVEDIMDLSNICSQKEESPPLVDPKHSFLFFEPKSPKLNVNNNSNNNTNSNNSIEQPIISSPSTTRKRTLNDTSNPSPKRRKIDTNNSNNNQNNNGNNNRNNNGNVNENNNVNDNMNKPLRKRKRTKSKKEEMDLTESESEEEMQFSQQSLLYTQTQTQQNDNIEQVIDINQIPLAHRELIDKAHAKFLEKFMIGYFNRDTLEIERAPNFCSNAMKKYDTLNIGGDYNKVKVKPVINNELPAYSMRIKHYYLYEDYKKRIYKNYNPQEVEKLQRLHSDDLRDYFIKSGRIVNKNMWEYDNFILIRLDYNRFGKIKREYETDRHYDSIEHIIKEARKINEDIRITFLFENVLQTINNINSKRTRDQEAYKDKWCPYYDELNFKDKISKIELFRDPTIHFHFESKDEDKVKAHVERIVKSFCDAPFKRMRIGELRRRHGNWKFNERDGKKTNLHLFKEILCLNAKVTPDKANKILKVFPTAQAFWRACKRSDDPKLLLTNTLTSRTVGAELSKNIYKCVMGMMN